MDCGCLEDVAGFVSSSSAPAKPIAPAAPGMKGLDGGTDSDLDKDRTHWKKCTEKTCARCKFVRLQEMAVAVALDPEGVGH